MLPGHLETFCILSMVLLFTKKWQNSQGIKSLSSPTSSAHHLLDHGKKTTYRTPAESSRLSILPRILHFINSSVQSNNFTGQNYWLGITCGICKYPNGVQPYTCSLLITFSKSYHIPHNIHISSTRESGNFLLTYTT